MAEIRISEDRDVPWYWDGVNLFADTPPQVKADFVSRAQCIEFRARQTIFSASDPGDKVFFLERGMAKIYHLSASGDITIFWFCMPGDLFGAGGISGSRHQSVHGQAVNRAVVHVLPRATFEDLIRLHPQLGINVIKLMGARLRLACDAVTDKTTRRTDARLARVLLRIVRQWGQPVEGGMQLGSPITHQEMANMVGASRQTVNQILKQFERAGWLRFDGRKLVLLEPDQLSQLVVQDVRPPTRD